MGQVLLFGGTGLLGSEIKKRWRPAWGSLAVVPRFIDIIDAETMVTVFGENRPNVVINCSAVSNVDESERNPLKAFEVNARGPEVLATMCQATGATLIHISTDYVFPDAPSNHPFTEKEYPNPVNEYGRSKWEGEKRVVMCERHYVLRTSSLYGTGRSNHAAWVTEAIQTGKPVKIAEDMVGSPTYVGDLAEWIGELILKNPPYGIYHLTHKGTVSRLDFAQKLCELKKVKKPYPVEKVSLASLKLVAPRPRRPLMSTEKWEKAVGPLPSWEEGLRHYLNEAAS